MFLKIFTVSTSHCNEEDPSGARTMRIKGLNKYIQHLKLKNLVWPRLRDVYIHFLVLTPETVATKRLSLLICRCYWEGEHPRWTTRSDPFMWKANLSASWRASKRGHHCLQLQSPCRFFFRSQKSMKAEKQDQKAEEYVRRPRYIQTQNGIHNEIIWNNSALQQN